MRDLSVKNRRYTRWSRRCSKKSNAKDKKMKNAKRKILRHAESKSKSKWS